MIDIPEHILNLEPYRPGKNLSEVIREKNLKKIVKLASNENPLGPSPKAIKTIGEYLGDLHRYPDPKAHELTYLLAKMHHRKRENIICAHGSDSLIAYCLNAFCSGENEILTSEGSFIGIYVNAKKLQRNLKLVGLKNYSFDLNAILKNVTRKTKIIYLANPNNPTGTCFLKEEFDQFLRKIPKNILIILDEAYELYTRDNKEIPNGMDYELDNLLVLRTLSKSHGLAGLRLGYAIGPQYLIDQLYKVKLPFEPHVLAQVAGRAALLDFSFLEQTNDLNTQSLLQMKKRFNQLGINFIGGAANFLMMVFPSEKYARILCEECLKEGLILRNLKPFGFPFGVRINSGTLEETEFALKIIGKVIRKMVSSFKVPKSQKYLTQKP